VISRNAVDGAEVTHFKISNFVNFAGGKLFLNDGVTEVNSDDFITFAQANAGLKFSPATNFTGTATFDIQASTSNSDSGLGGSVITATITVTPNFTPSVTNATTNEDTTTSSGLVITKNAADGNATTHFKITNILNGTLFQNDGTTQITSGSFITLAQASAGLKFRPTADFFGDGSFDIQASTSNSDTGLEGDLVTATITVNPVADTPFPPPPTEPILEDTEFAVSIFRNPVDGAEVTHFKITNITNGTLFLADGVTQVNDGDFITVAQGVNLKLVPSPDFFGDDVSFLYQASLNASDSGVGGNTIRAFAQVYATPDTPSVTNSTTNEDTQTTTGLVISRNAVDSTEVTHFKITNITNGRLFLNDGTTEIHEGNFITFAQANAGLKFSPTADFFGTGSFQVQASLSNSDSGLGGNTATATITVNAVADTPTISPATTDEDTATVAGLIIERNTADGAEVTHFKITGITNGTLFLNDGVTLVSDGDFITFAQGNAGLVFLPATDLNSTFSTFSFDVQASLSNSDAGLGGMVETAIITVNAVNDQPTVTLATNSITRAQNSGTFVFPSFATFTPGPATATDEATQTPTYLVSTTNGALFSTAPAIDANGQLTFTLASGASGTATVTVRVMDNGGTTPGIDTSAPRMFTIVVPANPVVVPPPVVPPGVQPPANRFIAVGTDAGTQGTVRVLNATTRQAIRDFTPYAGYTGGVRVATGDVNNDGVTDIITATATGVGHVKVFDGVTGGEIFSFMPFSGFPSGLHVATGDLNGDGKSDIVVGVDSGSSHVMAFSGADGSVLQSFFAFEGFMGGVRVAVGDVTGDGNADIAVVAGPGGNGHIKVFNGLTNALTTSFLGYVNYAGEINIAVGNVGGDFKDEVVTTAKNPTGGTHIKAVNASAETVLSFFEQTSASTAISAFRSGGMMTANPTAPARVATADLNGDNFADIILGSAPGGTSQLVFIDGVTTNTLASQNAFDPLFDLGVFVDGN
jgi:hypothetical protein